VAAEAIFGIANVAAAATPVAAAALKNLRLEGVFPLNVFSFFFICPPISNSYLGYLSTKADESPNNIFHKTKTLITIK
jgi:hypothetical protein